MLIEKNNDLLKLILNLLIIGLFIIVTYRVVEPFLFGFFWAVMVVITTWPFMKKLQQKLFNSRILAVFTMTTILSFFVIVPFIFVIISITNNGSFLLDFTKNLSKQHLPTLDWIANIPMIGNDLHQKWRVLLENDGSELVKKAQPYFGTVVSWTIGQLSNIGTFVFHCTIMIVFSALLFLRGEIARTHIYHLANRLSRRHGENTITLAGKSIRAVSLGVVVTAITLALIGGLTLTLTDMPFPGLFTLLLFICCVVQIGPVLIMTLCTIWQFWDGNIISGMVLVIVTIILTTLDSVMRTYLIKKGVDLPFLLILFGVIGGLLGFGIMGLFIGPVMLALSYNIIQAWIKEQS